MRDLCCLIWCAVVGLVRSRVALQAEILVLRHQLNVLRRKSPKRMALGNIDRVVLTGDNFGPNWLDAKSSSNILECTRHTFRYCLAKVFHLFTEYLPLRLHEIGLNEPEGLDILGFG